MKRIIIICEGETEREFCATILQRYFISKDIIIQSPLIKKTMGGIVNWNELLKQINHHLKSDLSVYVTTLLDYYGLHSKHGFPNWSDAENCPNKSERMDILEQSMKNSLDDSVAFRFIPYVQLHEFEGLLFNDINVFYNQIPEEELIGEDELTQTFKEYDNPEMINNNFETCPSRRLNRIIAGYNKIVYGNILAEVIGLERIRNKSPRFNEWIRKIEEI